MFKQLFCLLAFHFRFLFPFCHKMNACLLFLPVAVSLDFFVLELRVPCFVFFFLVHKEPWEGGCCFFIISSLLCSFFFPASWEIRRSWFCFFYIYMNRACFFSFFLSCCLHGGFKAGFSFVKERGLWVWTLSLKWVYEDEHCH